jgi:hypothetical protein
MARQRDYKAEYARRIARGKARGLSRSQARGHAKASEAQLRPKPVEDKSDARIEAAILAMNTGESLTGAARHARVSPERLRRFIVSQDMGVKQGRQWALADSRPRRVPIIKNTNIKAITVPGFDDASRVGQYHNQVGRFVRTQDLSVLQPFVGEGVTDISGKFHPFETDPNALIRYAMKDEPEFHEIYQIIQN